MDGIIITVFVSLFLLVKVLKYKGIIPTKPLKKRTGVWRFMKQDDTTQKEINTKDK